MGHDGRFIGAAVQLGLISAMANKGEPRLMVLDDVVKAPTLIRFFGRLVWDGRPRHRVLEGYDAIVEARCQAWNALPPDRLRSLTTFPGSQGSLS